MAHVLFEKSRVIRDKTGMEQKVLDISNTLREELDLTDEDVSAMLHEKITIRCGRYDIIAVNRCYTNGWDVILEIVPHYGFLHNIRKFFGVDKWINDHLTTATNIPPDKVVARVLNYIWNHTPSNSVP